MANINITDLELDGDVVDNYPVDESQANSNAGDATVFFYQGYYYEVIVWNWNAEYHEEDETTINFLGKNYKPLD